MSMKFSRRGILKATGATALGAGMLPSLSLVSYGANQPTKLKFTLPWIPHGAYSAFIMARELGYWKDRGLDVDVSRGYGSGDANQRVGLGEFDYGDASFSVTIQAAARGLDLIGLGLHMQVSPLAIFTLKKSGITEAKQLEGKTIGALPTTGDYQLWPAFANAAGIDKSTVTHKFLQGNVRAQTLLNGDIDALSGYYSTDAAPLWVLGADINIIPYHNYGIRMYDTGMITQSPRIKEHPEITAAFVEGALEGLKFTYLKPEEATDIHVNAIEEFRENPKGRETIAHQIAINTALGIHPGPKEHGLGWYIPEEVKANVEIAKKYMELAKDVDPEKIYTNEFLGTVKLTPEEWAQVETGVKDYIRW